MTKRPVADDEAETDTLADEAGTRAMVDLMLGTTALLLVVLLAVGAQAMRQQALPDSDAPPSTARLDALLAAADGPVLFAEARGIRLAGSDHLVTVSEIAANSRLPSLALTGIPTLVIAPDGIDAAFHLTARLAALGVPSVRRVRLERDCADIETIEIAPTGWRISCRRR
ncbi:hypothetical protein [Rhizobium alvei]|uniref:Uncharacterized protein n=1 Tax=Rhizobium alvei TaxID=1132659 RepID=A0ABT8YRW6_9HYPH|nr:hypothetical protein [Rhizobium alvei]MDO6966481.1 hypothetical protein [Rhizobium alvei]